MKKKSAKKTAPKRSAPKKAVKPIPAGYRVLTPYLSIRGAAAAIDFYKRIFGAKERMRFGGPDGKIGHAELVFGDCVVMLADEAPELDFLSPMARGGSSVNLHMYVKDVDALVAKAAAAGARITRPVKDQFYGDRGGSIQDPFGHIWYIATHKEDLSPAEMKRRGEEAAKQGSGAG